MGREWVWAWVAVQWERVSEEDKENEGDNPRSVGRASEASEENLWLSPLAFPSLLTAKSKEGQVDGDS